MSYLTRRDLHGEIRRQDAELTRLRALVVELRGACEKLLDYHMWAKAPGQWDTEPDDPAEEVITAIKHAQALDKE